MRWLLLISVTVLSISAIPFSVQGAQGSSMEICGFLHFDERLNETLGLNITIRWTNISGENLSASEIRSTYGTDEWNRTRSALMGVGKDVFNSTLYMFESHPIEECVKIYGMNSTGSIYMNISGTGRLNASEKDPELFANLTECGFSLKIALDERDNTRIEISVPQGWTIDGKESMEWDGSAQRIEIHHAYHGSNHADVMMDIYRMDTSGMQQDIYMNITVNATIYAVIPTEEMRSSMSDNFSLSMATIGLLNYLVDNSSISQKDFDERLNSTIDEMEEEMIRSIPGSTGEQIRLENYNDTIVVGIRAHAIAPIEAFESTGFLRWYASQKISMDLAGLDGFVVNYTIIVPEGMRILSIDSDHRISVMYTSMDGRSAVKASVSDGNIHRVVLGIGFVIDIDPLIPLFIALILSFILWVLIWRYVPERGGKRG